MYRFQSLGAINNMKENITKIGTLAVLLFTFSSCESYIAFEKMRVKIFVYFFLGSLLIGLLGMLFINRNGKK
jgi:hypothetical protein